MSSTAGGDIKIKAWCIEGEQVEKYLPRIIKALEAEDFEGISELKYHPKKFVVRADPVREEKLRRIKQAPVHTLAVYNGFEKYGGQDLGVGDVTKVTDPEVKIPEIHITADGAISREAIEVVTAVKPQADLGGWTSRMRGVIGNMKPRKNMKSEPKPPKNMKNSKI